MLELASRVVPGEPISPSGCFPGCIHTGSSNSEAANNDVFICCIYKHQPVNQGHPDQSCVFVVCHGFCDNGDEM